MEYDVRCECGYCHLVSEGAAGTRILCNCGRTIAVPSLDAMRRDAGLLPVMPSPELVIESLLAAGLLPGTKNCISCGCESGQKITVLAECERAWTPQARRSSWLSTAAMLLMAFVAPITLLFRIPMNDSGEQEYGRDKIYPLPLPLCSECQSRPFSDFELKGLLRRIEDYRRLLEKFPEAKVSLQSKPLNRFDGFS